MTGYDHTSEVPDAAPESAGGPHGPQRLDDASPQGDDARPGPATGATAPAAETPPTGPPAPSAPSPAAEKSPPPKRAGRSQKRPAAKSGASRGRRSSRPKVVPHLTPVERAARGKAARAEVAALGPRRMGARRRTGAIRSTLLEEQAATRVPELVPIRYGRMLVSPFTFFRGAAYLMASDLAGSPRTGLHVAALRRRAPLQLRRLRGARPAARLRRQRLRRDASGPVRVGPEATRRELRRRRPRPRLRRQTARRRSTSQSTRAYREAMLELRGHGRPRRLVRAHRGRRDLQYARAAGGRAKADQAGREEHREGAGEGQPARVREADRDSSTASRGSSATRR